LEEAAFVPFGQFNQGDQCMSLRINDTAPDFEAETTQGKVKFHEWIGDGWAILFSHPKDFTPVCTTELGYMAGLEKEFKKRNCKIIGLSVDPVGDHQKWSKDIEETQGHRVNYPLIGDPELKVAKAYDMLPAAAGDSSKGRTAADNATVRTVFLVGPDKKIKMQLTYPMIGDPELKVAKVYDMLPEDSGQTSQGRTAADNATVRSVFVIGPDKKVKAMLTYPMSTGRNFDEVLRLLDSCQLTAKHKVATPVNWKQGQDVIIVPAVSDAEAKQQYPGGWKSPKPYLRIVPQPR
jgi:alkyl hydroperoxide reductase subunit AhpC